MYPTHVSQRYTFCTKGKTIVLTTYELENAQDQKNELIVWKQLYVDQLEFDVASFTCQLSRLNMP